MNLRTKIHIASAGLVLIVVLGMITSLYMSEKKQLVSDVRQEQKDDLAKLARVYAEAMFEENEIIIFNYVKALVVQPKIAYAGFVSKSGTGWIYSGSRKPPIFADQKDPSVQAIMQSNRLIRRTSVSPEGKKVIEVSQPVLNLPSKKQAYVRLAHDSEVIAQVVAARLNKVIRKLWVVGFVAIIFGLILAHLAARALSKPILSLMKASNSIARGDKGITVPEAGEDELGDLTRTFNHMSKELVKLDELKDEFMSHVTHELRSPLTSIIATVELMDEMPIASKNQKIRRSVDRLKYGSERLNRLVDNILDLTRMEAGKMQFDIQPTEIGTLACEMADFFEPRAMEKNLTIKADVPEILPMAMADGERIRQVLSNLIYNAIKFTNEGGITLKVREVKGSIHVAVSDTGVGIPKDKLKSVFQKFECLKDTKDRVNKPVPGSGLGLNIVMNSLKSQNGRIWVESKVDEGTTFTFSLPVAKNASNARTKNHQEKSKHARDAENSTGVKRKMIFMEGQEEAI